MSDNVEALIAEAKAAGLEKYPPNHLVDDPEGETGYAESDPYGYNETARNAFTEGVEWALARRSPEPQQVSTVEELAALPITSVVLDVFAAVCVRASDSAGALDWRRVTPAVRGGEHRHFPYLPATVLYRPEGGEQ